MQREAEQATLFEVLLERQHVRTQVEERLRRNAAVGAKHTHQAILLNNELATAAVVGILDVDRRRQAFGDEFERHA